MADSSINKQGRKSSLRVSSVSIRAISDQLSAYSPSSQALRCCHFHVQILHQESELIGDLLNEFGRRFASPMAGARFDTSQYGRRAGLAVLQLGDELEAMAGHDAIVGVCRCYQRCGIFRALFEVMVRRVSIKGIKLLGIVRGAVIIGQVPPGGELLEA